MPAPTISWPLIGAGAQESPNNFVYDALVLDFPKALLHPLRPGDDPTRFILDGSWNTLCQGVIDTRKALLSGRLLGLSRYATAPTATGVTDRLWLRTDGTLMLHLIDGGVETDVVIAGNAVTQAYQTVQTGSTPITQRSTLSFNATDFHAYDSSSKSNVELLNQGSVTPGTFNNANVTVNAKGIITGIAAGSAGITQAYQTVQAAGSSIAQQNFLNFSAAFSAVNNSGASRSDIDLATQGGITPGAYTNANITVNAKGIVTAVANGAGGGGGTVTSIVAGSGLTGGTITGSGTIAIANTAVTPGSYTNANITVGADGRLTAAANGSAGGSTTQVELSYATLANANAGNVTTPGGSTTVGIQCAFLLAATITGVRFYWKSVGGARTVKCTVWDPSGTSQGTVSVSVNASGIYTGSFGSPIAVASSQLYQKWFVVMWDTSGGNYVTTTVSGVSFPANTTQPFQAGPNFILAGSGWWVSGDAKPTTSTNSEIYPIEPVFTCP